MPYDLFAPKGSTSASRPDAGSANLRSVPVFGIVKDNVDPVKAGRIQVYIDDLGGNDPDNADSWITVSYLPPFYGYTQGTAGKTGYGELTSNPASYGMWFSPPDIGTEVICLFVNGDTNYGFYIGAVPKPEALRMVPAIGANFDTEKVVFNESEAQSYGGATRLPVTNANINNGNLTEGADFVNAPKPVHSYSAYIMNQQGILRDPIRGPISTSAQRESPSRVGWGVSTPGRPIYQGGLTDENVVNNLTNTEGLQVIGRRGGHSIIMDDGDLIGNDQLIRLRTALGHQILMSDNGQTLMILHANGQSYIELGKEGTIDMYSTNSVNIRTQGDLNLHADNNININATKKLNVYAESMNFESKEDFNQKVGATSSIYTMGKHTHRSDGSMAFLAQDEASIASSAVMYLSGSKLNLNSGLSSLTPETVPSLQQVAQTDTLYDNEKGFIAAPGKLNTIVTRAPAHAPWTNAGQGVNVKTSLDATSQLPKNPSAEVASTNANAGPVNPSQAVTASGIATVPSVSSVSQSIDKATTGSLVGAAAQMAATGPLASAVEAGAGIVKNAQGQLTAAVGATGLTPPQLEQAGFIKPGSALLVDSMIKQGANLTQAMNNGIFTGKNGITDLGTFVNNSQAQAQATVDALQKSQQALTGAGVITGNESPSAISGLVLSGATCGVAATVDVVKNAGSNAVASAATAVGGASDSIKKTISAGNYAAGASTTSLGGLSSIGESITKTVDKAKDAVLAAFDTIKNSFKPFKAGVPQDLNAIAQAQKAGEKLVDSGKAAVTGLTSGLNLSNINSGFSNAASTIGNIANTAITTIRANVDNSFSSFKGGIASINGLITTAKNISTGNAAAAASGVTNLVGGQESIASVANLAPAALNQLPVVEQVGVFIKNVTTATTIGISTSQAANAALASGNPVSATAGGLIQSLQATGGNIIGNFANNVANGAKTLSSLVLSGLPAGVAANLQAQLTSLSTIGETKISLPSIGVDTTDRSAITAKAGQLLGNNKIPVPSYSGISTTATSTLQKLQEAKREKEEKVKEIDQRYFVQKNISDSAKANYEQAKSQLPEGDPQIEALRAVAIAELIKLSKIGDEYTLVYKEYLNKIRV